MKKQRQVGAIKSFHRNTSADCPLFYAKTHGRIHSLSHDTVEIMIKKYSKNGMPLAHIQQLLGHENMSTTSGFYAFATIETLSNLLSLMKNYSDILGLGGLIHLFRLEISE